MVNGIKNMKIRKKLMLLVGIILVGMLIVAALAFFLMNGMNNATEEVAVEWMDGVDDTRRMDTLSSDIRADVLNCIVKDDQAQRDQLHSEIDKDLAEINALIEEYKVTCSDGEDERLLYALIEQWDTYLKYHEKLLSLVDQEKDDEALALYEGDSKGSYDNVTAAMADLVQYNVDGAHAARDYGKNLFHVSWIALIIGVIVLISLGAFFSKLIIGGIQRPVNEIGNALRGIARGELDVQVHYRSRDELGGLAEDTGELVYKLKNIIEDETQFLGKMAEGNLDVDSICPEEYSGAFQPLLTAFRAIAENMNDAMTNIFTSSQQVSNGAEQVSDGAQSLAQGATEQASSIEELSASINEISDHVQESAEYAKNASSRANEVGDSMESSNGKMQEMVRAMEDISASSDEIAKIIKTIEDIAFQTNILALNAAVEAARAGEAGKGFAVVADEVRNLAGKSAEASTNTAALIETSLQAVNRGSSLANDTAEALLVAVEGAQEVAATVDKISEASELQAGSLAQVTSGLDQISGVVQTNSATAEESAAASEELSGQATILQQQVNRFQLKGVKMQDAQQTGNLRTLQQETISYGADVTTEQSDSKY